MADDRNALAVLATNTTNPNWQWLYLARICGKEKIDMVYVRKEFKKMIDIVNAHLEYITIFVLVVRLIIGIIRITGSQQRGDNQSGN